MGERHGGRKNSGRPLSQGKVREIFQRRLKNESLSAIAREMGLCRTSVRKYVRDPGLCPAPVEGQVPTPHAEGESAPVARYAPAESLLESADLIVKMKRLMKINVDSGQVPAVTNPLHVKQLVEAERALLSIPQDIGRVRISLYEQIHTRDLGAAIEVNDNEALACAGELGDGES